MLLPFGSNPRWRLAAVLIILISVVIDGFSRRHTRERFVAVLLRLLNGSTSSSKPTSSLISRPTFAIPSSSTVSAGRLGFIDRLKQKDTSPVRCLAIYVPVLTMVLVFLSLTSSFHTFSVLFPLTPSSLSVLP